MDASPNSCQRGIITRKDYHPSVRATLLREAESLEGIMNFKLSADLTIAALRRKLLVENSVRLYGFEQ